MRKQKRKNHFRPENYIVEGLNMFTIRSRYQVYENRQTSFQIFNHAKNKIINNINSEIKNLIAYREEIRKIKYIPLQKPLYLNQVYSSSLVLNYKPINF